MDTNILQMENYITSLDDVSTCTPEETIGQVLHLVNNSHDAVFVFDEKNNLIGLINPYQELYKKRHIYTTKVQTAALIPKHLTSSSSFFDVFEYMLESRIYTLPIFQNHEKKIKKVMGKIYVKDLLKGLLSDSKFVLSIAENLVPAKPVSIHQNSQVKDVYNILRKKEISRMILVDDEGTLSGIVSCFDIQKAFISPTPRQRFHKKSGDSGEFMFDEEEITRRDEPVKKYETYIVSKVIDGTPIKNFLEQVINSNLDDIVLVDKANRPVGILTTRDILKAVLNSQPEILPEIKFQRPDGIGQKEINLANEFLEKFTRKLNKRTKIDILEIHFKEAKFTTGKVAEYDATLRVELMNGKNYIAKSNLGGFLATVKEVIKELEKQITRDRDQVYHHRSIHHGADR